jgi:hypothetical protein
VEVSSAPSSSIAASQKRGGKKSTDHRLNQACQPCATLSSTSSFDRFSDARTAEDGSARDRGVN